MQSSPLAAWQFCAHKPGIAGFSQGHHPTSFTGIGRRRRATWLSRRGQLARQALIGATQPRDRGDASAHQTLDLGSASSDLREGCALWHTPRQSVNRRPTAARCDSFKLSDRVIAPSSSEARAPSLLRSESRVSGPGPPAALAKSNPVAHSAHLPPRFCLSEAASQWNS